MVRANPTNRDLAAKGGVWMKPHPNFHTHSSQLFGQHTSIVDSDDHHRLTGQRIPSVPVSRFQITEPGYHLENVHPFNGFQNLRPCWFSGSHGIKRSKVLEFWQPSPKCLERNITFRRLRRRSLSSPS
ncbi:hypothetical protein Pst134EA_017696 [Puccinia striiformis f. sp. tritici]|uniref:hypothetical protein n=1 Tax=Puccinia striiformis f. sp. tritici TaxID=168172 RepID=UPI0020079915|nr:hypothetical protein Pst134EA_017696 [Puccinia striiformis f. sp. tritici]KAH9461390.1 hypothetical protein Pst134EA_017696 [Puccinia striiformis f. sp. tritici]